MQKTTSKDLLGILGKRAAQASGILIFNLKNQLVYMNPEARTILPHSFPSRRSKQLSRRMIPQEVSRLCNRLKKRLKTAGRTWLSGTVSLMTVRHSPPTTYVLRGMFLQNRQHAKDQENRLLMIVIEKLSRLGVIELKKAKQHF